jgi:hypothetical protein
MAKPTTETKETQLALRLTRREVEALDRLAASLAALVPGSKPSRSAALRAAMTRGIEALVADGRPQGGGP